jgi:hypothetical protein
MTKGASIVVAAVMASFLVIILQFILLLSSWLNGMTLYRWTAFAVTCWIALLNGSYLLLLYGYHWKNKSHGNKQGPTEPER